MQVALHPSPPSSISSSHSGSSQSRLSFLSSSSSSTFSDISVSSLPVPTTFQCEDPRILRVALLHASAVTHPLPHVLNVLYLHVLYLHVLIHNLVLKFGEGSVIEDIDHGTVVPASGKRWVEQKQQHEGPPSSHTSPPEHHTTPHAPINTNPPCPGPPLPPGGDLLALVNTDAAWTRLRESVLQRMWCELCRAVGWMHGVGLVHRDIKLEISDAILFSARRHPPDHRNLHHPVPASRCARANPRRPPRPAAPLLKLTDFGLSRFVDIRSEEERARDRAVRKAARRAASPERPSNGVDPEAASRDLYGHTGEDEDEVEEEEDEDEEDEGPLLSTRCGSEAYAAPELVTGGTAPPPRTRVTRTRSRVQQKRGARGVYDARETDAWACGVVLYALVGRRLPFGEGVGGNGVGVGVGIGREGEGEGRGVESRMARRAWLMRIARGEYEWPEASAAGEGDGELMGRGWRRPRGHGGSLGGCSLGIRGNVPCSDGRASPALLDGEEWEVEEVEADVDGGGEMGEEEMELALAEAEEEVDEFGVLVDQDGIDDIARQEVV
ncbi:hypothetical protein FPV67DRAFT_1783559 [Lyophyllum atratum]|nr:hypothetical protein FPV67DRAFT_1783559 [Lyophyllum atratum]